MSGPDPIDWEAEEERTRAYADGDPTGWFDELYARGAFRRADTTA